MGGRGESWSSDGPDEKCDGQIETVTASKLFATSGYVAANLCSRGTRVTLRTVLASLAAGEEAETIWSNSLR